MEISYALDTFYFLICGALVMWMAAGFTCLEAGLVRAKNTTEILTKNVALYAIACMMYLLCGYQIMYGDVGMLFLGAEHVAQSEDAYYSQRSDFFFQVVFVATAMSIVSGAVAERMKLWAFLAFTVVLTGFIYPMSGQWTWGGGFLSELGYSDFAGSGIVHLAGAAAALAGVLLLGARSGKYGPNGSVKAFPGANLPLAAIGMFILWFGWFGFNGGSQLKLSTFDDANAVAQIFVNTNMAACAGLVVALILSKLFFKMSDLTMAINGALAGLVAITADPLSPSPEMSMVYGALAGFVVMLSIVTLDKLKIDDPVGAISVHGVVGILGLMLVPICNADATFQAQAIGVAVIFSWVFFTSLVVWAILKYTVGIRVCEIEEKDGIDMTENGMKAYNIV